jgi:hypothetical protein
LNGLRAAEFRARLAVRKGDRRMCGSLKLPILTDGQRSVSSKKVRRPWQDRRTLYWLCSLAAAPTASRRLAYGFRAFAKTMRDNRNVQYSSCAT